MRADPDACRKEAVRHQNDPDEGRQDGPVNYDWDESNGDPPGRTHRDTQVAAGCGRDYEPILVDER